jgi:hypothetical protein
VPARLHDLVEIADTPEGAAEAVVAGIARVRGPRIAETVRG